MGCNIGAKRRFRNRRGVGGPRGGRCRGGRAGLVPGDSARAGRASPLGRRISGPGSPAAGGADLARDEGRAGAGSGEARHLPRPPGGSESARDRGRWTRAPAASGGAASGVRRPRTGARIWRGRAGPGAAVGTPGPLRAGRHLASRVRRKWPAPGPGLVVTDRAGTDGWQGSRPRPGRAHPALPGGRGRLIPSLAGRILHPSRVTATLAGRGPAWCTVVVRPPRCGSAKHPSEPAGRWRAPALEAEAVRAATAIGTSSASPARWAVQPAGTFFTKVFPDCGADGAGPADPDPCISATGREGRPFGGSLARWQLRPGAKRQVTWSAMPRAMAAYAPCSSARDRPARRRDPSCAREKARDQTATAGNDGRSCLRARR